MAELVTIARPYAQAIFSLAKDSGQLSQWSQMLRFLLEVWDNERVRLALANPHLTRSDVAHLLLGLCGERLSGVARNLLVLLVQNGRLAVLPELVELYERLREDYDNVVEADVDSAFPLSAQQLAILSAALERHVGRKVQMKVTTVPDLIGGVSVRIGDDVWDASVRGQLDSMGAALTN